MRKFCCRKIFTLTSGEDPSMVRKVTNGKVAFWRICVLQKNSKGIHIIFCTSENNSPSEIWCLITNLIVAELEYGDNGASVPFETCNGIVDYGSKVGSVCETFGFSLKKTKHAVVSGLQRRDLHPASLFFEPLHVMSLSFHRSKTFHAANPNVELSAFSRDGTGGKTNVGCNLFCLLLANCRQQRC